MIPGERMICVACGLAVDPRGVEERRWCHCSCKWPNGGCGTRIYFQLSVNERKQPFDLEGGRPHHATCSAYLVEKQRDRLCPRCGGTRAKGAGCRHCGWEPGVDPRLRPPPDPQFRIDDFGSEGLRA